jgi:hypothetical protein
MAKTCSSFSSLQVLVEVARASTSVAQGQRDVVTEDGILVGWLEVKTDNQWRARFLQLKPGSLTTFGCAKVRTVQKSNWDLHEPPMPESAKHWLRPEVTRAFRISKEALLFCTESQRTVIRNAAANPGQSHIIVCFRENDQPALAPLPVYVRVAPDSLLMVDLEDPIEYTLIALHLSATDEAVSETSPFGLVVNSEQSDQMFVPLDNLHLAAPNPFMILQWMGGLRQADLDPVQRTETVMHGTSATRGSRADSGGALLAQLVSGAMGRTKGSFGGFSDGEKPGPTNKEQRKNLVEQLRYVTMSVVSS